MKPFLWLAFWLLASWAFGAKPNWNDAVKASVRKHFPSGVRVEVESARATIAPTGRFRIQGFTPELPLGLVGFQVEVDGPHGVTKGTGTATIRAFAPIAVAKSPLSHGENLDTKNVAYEERELSRLVQSGYFLGGKELEGRTARGYVAAGNAISRANSQLPFEIVAGQSVDMIRRKGSLTLTAKVRAMQSGRRNQWVQIQNPSSGKILVARVTGPGEVETR